MEIIFYDRKFGEGVIVKKTKEGWVVLNTKDNNLYYSMDYKKTVDKVKKWTLAPRQNALKKELLRVYNDPLDMEHGCNRQCKRVKERLSLKSKKSKIVKKKKTRKKIFGIF